MSLLADQIEMMSDKFEFEDGEYYYIKPVIFPSFKTRLIDAFHVLTGRDYAIHYREDEGMKLIV